jgi:hypothetical protein
MKPEEYIFVKPNAAIKFKYLQETEKQEIFYLKSG